LPVRQTPPPMQGGKQATGSQVFWSAARVYPEWQLHRKLPKVLMQKCEQRVSHGSTEHSSTSETLARSRLTQFMLIFLQHKYNLKFIRILGCPNNSDFTLKMKFDLGYKKVVFLLWKSCRFYCNLNASASCIFDQFHL
jgi:hypothetical protein